jgi:uncharacterized protein YkwD
LAGGAALSVALAIAGALPARADTLTPVPLPSIAIQVEVPGPSVDVLEAALLVKLNAERAAAGLLPLATQPWAQSVARAHSEDMAAARSIWHNHTGYLDIAKQTINAYLSGENVAEAGTLDEADALLTASPPHLANILYPAFNYVGIGVAMDLAGYVYVTQDFVTIRPASAITTRAGTSAATAPAHTSPRHAATPAVAALNPAAVPAPDPSHTPDSGVTPVAGVAKPAAAASPLPRISPFSGTPVATTRKPATVRALWGLAFAGIIGVSGTWFARRRQATRSTS